MKKEYNPLVSVIVITYNSSDYIIETLESVKSQTYKNLEVVVSDDCSSDNTVQLVSEWFDANKDCFKRTKLVTVENNKGVTANYNRAIKNCEGEWIKCVDGDDILISTCVEDNLDYIGQNPEAQFVLSNSVVFFDNGRKEQLQKPAMNVSGFFDLSAEKQFEELINDSIVLNPNSQFVKASIYDTIKYDERISSMEDRPFFWNCSRNGIRFYYMNKETVKYRKHEGALTGIAGKRLLSLRYYDSWTTFYYLVRKAEMENRHVDVSKDEKRILWYLFAKYVFKNRGNLITRSIKSAVERWLL